jgi:hypothetical protein
VRRRMSNREIRKRDGRDRENRIGLWRDDL